VDRHVNRVAVLGSTGSVGTQTLDVARHLGERVQVVALAGGRNADLLSRQMAEFRPRLYSSLSRIDVRYSGGCAATLEEIASDEGVDTVVVATSGSVGLSPVLAALRQGKTVALANKETLVMAGEIVMDTARRFGGRVIPVDSEHSAIFQCLQGESSPVRRLLLTASGGPFCDCTPQRLAEVGVVETLAHPVWSMGRKITVDSATLMNKGLEIIEAHWLFGVPFDSIEVVVHTQCLVHSMVEFCDGSIKAQMSQPTMTLPIQYALTHPERCPSLTASISWTHPLSLSFEPADPGRFPCLRLAREAGEAGRTYPAALCGGDEAAVTLFLQERIPFNRIAGLVEQALGAHCPGDGTSLDAVSGAERWAFSFVMAHAAGTNVEDAAQPGARL
jgi:1-deoxy-D-xylulose-5-phosphate reductoisomerase